MQFEIYDLGLTDFKAAWDFQKKAFSSVKNNDYDHALIFCQHFPVITLGRRANKDNLLVHEKELARRGIEICEIERGGDVTYHGPGQLTVYPVLNLGLLRKDIHKYLRYLENVILDLLCAFDINAGVTPVLTGVWVGNRKVASIGVAIRNWITFHGFSINIKKDDLANFKLIRPCGMDIEMTSIEEILGKSIEVAQVKQKLIQIFKDATGFQMRMRDEDCIAGIR